MENKVEVKEGWEKAIAGFITAAITFIPSIFGVALDPALQGAITTVAVTAVVWLVRNSKEIVLLPDETTKEE